MFENIYRKLLIILFAGICSLIYVAADSEYKNMNLNESVLASEEASYNVEGSPDANSSLDDSIESDENGQEVHMVVPSGEPIGIYVKTDGVMVIDVGEITGADGKKYSPCNGKLQRGDYILSVNCVSIEDKNDLIALVSNSGGSLLNMEVRRNGERITVDITPGRNADGDYMLGLWVKDDISGIGTMTYIDENGFGALGHSINDNDTGVVFSISDGAIYNANLVNIVKSDGNIPGRLEGMIDYSSDNIVGRVEKNGKYGISGYMTKNGIKKLESNEWIPVAKKDEAHLGKAYILSSVSGNSEYYDVEITGIDTSSSSGGKGIELKITDTRLLGLTSGIVQGMSGTPIIQDGKLLGAVTHVFLKDSTKGYGTFVESMMKEND